MKRTLPFKESAVRFGELCAVKEETDCYNYDPSDSAVFTWANFGLNPGDIVMPIEFVEKRGFRAVRCVTSRGVCYLKIKTAVERLTKDE